MKMMLLLPAIAVVLWSCDPAYHLEYAVMNDTDRPVYCLDRTKTGAASVIRVEADSVVMVYEEAGLGFGKIQFRETRPEIAKRFEFFSDSTLADSSRIVPSKGWKYYRLPLDSYNARVYIRRKDLQK